MTAMRTPCDPRPPSSLADLGARSCAARLTILGITWGTVAVVVLLAFGAGLAAQMQRNARGIGEQVVILSGGTTTRSFAGFPEGRRIRLVEEDVQLRRAARWRGSAASAPSTAAGTRCAAGGNASNPFVTGVYPAYEELRNVFPEAGGRFLNDAGHGRGAAGWRCWATSSRSSSSATRTRWASTVFIGETPFRSWG